MRNLLALVGAAVIGFGVAGWYFGWYQLGVTKSNDGNLHVDVWYQNRAVSTQVGTGLVGNELTQITSGLSDGQQVLLSAPHGLPAPSPTG